MRDTGSLDYYLEAVQQQDTHKRLKIAEELVAYLADSSNPLDLGAERLIDGLTAWAGSSNFRISQYGLEILAILAERMEHHFKSHLNSVLPTVVDRLGDTKAQVREQAQALLLVTMGPVSSPQHVFEILNNSFGHKNWRVRDELMVCLMKTIKRFGASSLQISKLMPSLCKLLGDPTSQVRETAINTIVEVYRHVGEKVRNDIAKRGLPAARLNTLNAKFDECLRNDTMVAPNTSASNSHHHKGVNSSLKVNGETDTHHAKPSKPVRRSQSFNAPKKASSMERVGSSSASATGAVDETDFISAWEEVPELRIYNNKDLMEELGKINTCLSNANNDWEKRVQALKHVRSIGKHFGDHDQLPKLMRELEGSFKVSAKDLRSAVAREACITLSYLSYLLGSQFDYLAEALFPSLINLIPNSAKIMSTSGHCAIRLIIKHTCAPRLIPVLVTNVLTNKSKDIRRKVGEYIDLLLEMWETSAIKGHVALLEEAIRKGVGDADSEARAAMRRAFWHFADHYKDRAESLMHTLDASKQKLLQSDKNLLQAGVSRPSSSFGGHVKTKSSSKMRSTSSSSNQDNDRGAMPPPSWRPNNGRADRASLSKAHPGMQRSSSHLEGRPTASPAMEPRQKSCDDFGRGSANRQGRPRLAKRPAASQPSSRSGSPSRYGTHLLTRERSEGYMTLKSPLKTKIPTPSKPTSRSASRTGSRATSRDVSPSRTRTLSGSNANYVDQRARYNSTESQGRYLSEDALWNAYERSPARRRYDSQGSRNNDYSSDEESETSSVCSERSYGSQNIRKAQISQDTKEIIGLLHSQSWSERRDGLAALQVYLQGQKRLSLEETLRVKDAFNRFFADPHNKVYSLFLDVLSEFIVLFKTDLQDWLFIILTRLLQKLGTEMLPSLNSKVARVLDVVRDSFPYDHQFQILTKYVTDNTQTPNLRMKVAILQYLQGLISLMDPSDFVNTAAIRLAVSRIIAWTSEPKSAEVRKEATAVIVTLFELNTPEFSMMLSQLPNSFQDGATRLLHNHLKPMQLRQNQTPGSPEADDIDSEDFSSNFTYPRKKEAKARLGYRSISPTKIHAGSPDMRTPQLDSIGRQGSHSPTRPAVGVGAEAGDSGSRIPVRTRLNFSPSPESPVPSPGKGGQLSKHSGVASSPGDLNNTTTMFSLSRVSPPNYDPKHYEDRVTKLGNGTIMNGNDSTFLSPEMVRVADGAEEPDKAPEGPSMGNIGILSQIITVLSAPGTENSSDDVKDALLELIKMLRGEPQDVMDDMATLIAAIIGVVGHQEAVIRCLSIRALREVIRSYPKTCEAVIGDLITALLQAQADAQKEVVKTAEECCSLVAGTLNHTRTVSTLIPLIESAPFPTNLAAIKLLNTVVDNCDVEVVSASLADIMPHLLKSYEHEQSSVRKASVLCLVAVHNAVGEEAVMPYLKDLQGSKIKLLNLYIKRSQAS